MSWIKIVLKGLSRTHRTWSAERKMAKQSSTYWRNERGSKGLTEFSLCTNCLMLCGQSETHFPIQMANIQGTTMQTMKIFQLKLLFLFFKTRLVPIYNNALLRSGFRSNVSRNEVIDQCSVHALPSLPGWHHTSSEKHNHMIWIPFGIWSGWNYDPLLPVVSVQSCLGKRNVVVWEDQRVEHLKLPCVMELSHLYKDQKSRFVCND